MLIQSPSDLARFFREQRKMRGISQTKIADTIDSRQDSISKFENRPDSTRFRTIMRLIEALDLELHLSEKQESRSKRPRVTRWEGDWG